MSFHHTAACAKSAQNCTGSIQRKPLTISRSSDALEHEADRVADRVMGGDGHAPLSRGAPRSLNRKCAACAEEETLARRESRQGGRAIAGGFAPPAVHDVLATSGQPLDSAARAFFEPRLGRSFADVRVHADDKAAASARMVGAQAYTVGSHIVFESRRYAPSTPSGRRLLAHELAHVVQQGGGAPQSGISAAGAQAQTLQRTEICNEDGLCRSEEGPEESRMETSPKASVSDPPTTSQQSPKNPAPKSSPAPKSTTAQPATPKAADLDPPGKCTKARYKELDRAVGVLCKGPKLSCKEWNQATPASCDLVKERLLANIACVKARLLLMKECFGGGDERHLRVVREQMEVLKNCFAIYLRCRKAEKKGKEEAAPATAPAPVPQPKPASTLPVLPLPMPVPAPPMPALPEMPTLPELPFFEPIFL
jgi:uncharacterized protein DUF4157/putative RNase toxin 16 of polymorphic toxin system